MKAAIMPEAGKIELVDVVLPEMQDDEVLVDVKAVGICTFEQKFYYGKSNGFPFAGGHEICGVVNKVGSKVAQDLKTGDKVVVLSLTRCGECYYCRHGYDNQCENAKDVQKVPGVDGPGGFAEQFIAKGYEVYKIDEDVPFERGTLAEPLSCVTHSMNMSGIQTGDYALISGAGAMGIIHVLLAKLRGAKVIVSEPTKERRDRALEFGADYVVDPIQEDLEATGVMHVSDLASAVQNIGFYVPLPQLGLLGGKAMSHALTYLPLIIAYAFSDVTALLQGVEQAEKGGDHYEERVCLIATGCANIIGSLFGNPFPLNEYWGHPAWKKAKAGTAYSLYTGVIYLALCMSGLVAIATSAIPAAATLILLIFVAISTGTQSYSTVNKKYYPAMIIATAIPIFELMYSKILNGSSAATSAIAAALKGEGIKFAVDGVKVTSDHLASAGVSQGYFFLGKGSMMIAIVYSCILIFIIDRKWLNTAVAFIVAAFCAFVGLIHSESVKINANPQFAIIYVIMAVFFLIVYFVSKNNKELQPTEEHIVCSDE